MRPVLRYHGGKWILAKSLIPLFPPHRVYVEPFCGAASVLMQKPRAYAEVLNDKWDVVVNVFQCLRDASKAEELRRQLYLTPFARSEFNGSCGHAPQTVGDIEAARLAILRSFAGFGSASTNGAYATGFRCNSNRSGTTPAHEWANFPDCIPWFVERLRGVVIENRDALEVIAQQDSPETLFFCDPPYVHDTRNMARGNAAYAFEMGDAEHRALAESLHAVRGMVVLSGYASDLYDVQLYPCWKRIEIAARADGARKRTEIVWVNPAAAKAMRQLSLL